MKNKLNDLLIKKGKNKSWLSQSTGITYANIHKLCNTENPIKVVKLKTLDKICTALGCTLNDIFEHEVNLKTVVLMYKNSNDNISRDVLIEELKKQKGFSDENINSVIELLPQAKTVTVTKDGLKMEI